MDYDLKRDDVINARATIVEMEARFYDIVKIGRKHGFFFETTGKYNTQFHAFEEAPSGEGLVVFREYRGDSEDRHYVPIRLFWHADDSIDAYYENERKEVEAEKARAAAVTEMAERRILAALKAKYEGVKEI